MGTSKTASQRAEEITLREHLYRGRHFYSHHRLHQFYEPGYSKMPEARQRVGVRKVIGSSRGSLISQFLENLSLYRSSR